MNVHKNARFTAHGRERIVRQVVSGQTSSPKPQASARGPHRLRQPTPASVVAEIERLRRQRWTGKQIAVQVRVSPATVSRVLRRLGLNKLGALEPAEPIRRYEREHPGELIHLDIKKLGRAPLAIASQADEPGWLIVTSASAGNTFMPASMMPRASLSCRSWPINAKKSAVAFLEAAIAYYAKLGVRVERVMTDNG
jgi:hypothetical protein